MIIPKKIANQADYDSAIIRIAEIFMAAPGTAEAEECSKLVELVEDYEDSFISELSLSGRKGKS